MKTAGKPQLRNGDLDHEVAARHQVLGHRNEALHLRGLRRQIHVRVEHFTDLLVAEMEKVTPGAAYDYAADMGSLVSRRQLESVTALVEDARTKGAQVRTGGHPLPEHGPWFYAPTVLTGVTPQMRVHTEEVFGPVLAVYGYTTLNEAVTAANDSTYGLNASVWRGNLRRARQVAVRLRAGTVNVNDAQGAAYASIDAAAGGVKGSGVGHRHGDGGLLKYTDRITIGVQRRQLQKGPGNDWSAVTEQTTKVMRLLRKLPF